MGDAENSLIHLFPAIDRSAKNRFPNFGVGRRIKQFISDEEAVVTKIATGSIIVGGEFGGYTFAEAIYEFGRNSLIHEGELDPRIEFSSNNFIKIGETWELNHGFIFGLIIAVVLSPQNEDEQSPYDYELRLFEQVFGLNSIWGKKSQFPQLQVSHR